MKDIKDITDPLEAVHEIQKYCRILDKYISAMRLLGMDGNSLEQLMDHIFFLSEVASDGIMKEANDRFKDS